MLPILLEASGAHLHQINGVSSWYDLPEARGLAPASINQRLSALRKPAKEATYAGLLDPAAAQGIRNVPGAKVQGTRTGNWLTRTQAEKLINRLDTTTLKGRRDRDILAVMIGCGLRREEVAKLRFTHVQQREGRWCVVDIRGKHGRIRTVPMPSWAKAALDEWAAAAEISEGAVFRGRQQGRPADRRLAHLPGCLALRGEIFQRRPARSAADLRQAGPQGRCQARSDPAIPRPRFADDYRARCKQRIRGAINDRIGIEP